MKQGCPLCKKTIYSDITTDACQLCGMPLEKSQTLILKQDDEKVKFCSKHCLQQYKQEVIT